jgi:hypothetical protein
MSVLPVVLPKPLELVVKGRADAVGYACPKCGASFLVHNRKNPERYEEERKRQYEESAGHCVKDCPCGKPIEDSYRLRCRGCMDQIEADKEAALFQKSRKLTIEEYDGPLYWEGHSASMGDGYFADIDEVLDYCEQEGADVPEYVWTCVRDDFKIEAETAVSHALSDMYEEAFESISEESLKHLQSYLDAWCKEQCIVGWHSDHSRAVLLHEAPAMTG